MKKKFRLLLGLALVAITIIAFIHYLANHHNLITQLAHTPISIIVVLLVLYFLWFGALGLIVVATMRLCNKTLGLIENFLLNSYSTLVNFFIPGQGGIAVRAVYLKKIKKLAIRDYIFASLIYYMFYAIISTVFILADSRPFWETAVATIGTVAISLGIIYLYKKRNKVRSSGLRFTPFNLAFLFMATLLQCALQASIFSVELSHVNSHIAIHQAITYTGIANFSLFVALTPGAIGIRESFLIFTRKLYDVTSANIIAANVIDRAVFLVFLGLLFVLTLAFHTKYIALVKQSKRPIEEDENNYSLQSSANDKS